MASRSTTYKAAEEGEEEDEDDGEMEASEQHTIHQQVGSSGSSAVNVQLVSSRPLMAEGSYQRLVKTARERRTVELPLTAASPCDQLVLSFFE